MRRCPNGHEVSDDVKFCPQCGSEIQENTSEEIRFCKKCGSERMGTEIFCSHCGTPFYGCPDFTPDNPRTRKNSHGSSHNKLLLFFLIILTILIGGYFVYNHIQEVKRLEKERIEEQERAAEEKRRQIEEEEKRKEEESKPINVFFETAATGDYLWESDGYSFDFQGFRLRTLLYFYPSNKGGGRITFLHVKDDYRGYSAQFSSTGGYSCSENFISATISGGGYFGSDTKWNITLNLVLEKNGNTIILKRILPDGKEVAYIQKRRFFNDPYIR